MGLRQFLIFSIHLMRCCDTVVEFASVGFERLSDRRFPPSCGGVCIRRLSTASNPIRDLRLRSGTGAVDAGQVLPNFNDGYAGKAPDLGAYERGSALPHYGPRPERRERPTMPSARRGPAPETLRAAAADVGTAKP